MKTYQGVYIFCEGALPASSERRFTTCCWLKPLMSSRLFFQAKVYYYFFFFNGLLLLFIFPDLDPAISFYRKGATARVSQIFEYGKWNRVWKIPTVYLLRVLLGPKSCGTLPFILKVRRICRVWSQRSGSPILYTSMFIRRYPLVSPPSSACSLS